MPLTDAEKAAIHATVGRQIQQGRDIAERAAAAIDTLPVDALREMTRLYVEEVGYLGEHLPEWRENALRFPCTGNGYHGCSYTLVHDPGCKAAGGTGDLETAYKNARSCSPTCEADASDEPWCHVSGFDCPDCEMVDRLLAILAAHDA